MTIFRPDYTPGTVTTLAIGGEFDGQYISGSDGQCVKDFVARRALPFAVHGSASVGVKREYYMLRAFTIVKPDKTEKTWRVWLHVDMHDDFEIFTRLLMNYRPIAGE